MRWAVVGALLLAAAPASSTIYEAADLERRCLVVDDKKDSSVLGDSMDAGMCAGFIHGVNETVAYWRGIGKGAPFCLPDTGVSIDQARRIYLKYTKENPKSLNERVGWVYIVALSEAFPCPAK